MLILVATIQNSIMQLIELTLSVLLDVIALLMVSLVDRPLPMWTYPFLFYIQVYKNCP